MGLCGSSLTINQSQINSSKINEDISIMNDSELQKNITNETTFNYKAKIGERELAIYVKKKSKIEITLINDKESSWSFLPNDNLTNILGNANYKYKDNNIGCLLARISTSKKYYSPKDNIIKFTAEDTGSLIITANLDPNNYSLYEPKGIINLLIKGGEKVSKNKIDKLTGFNYFSYDKKNKEKYLSLENQDISRYINKARCNIEKYINNFILDFEDKTFNTKKYSNLPLCQINNILFEIAEEHCKYLSINGTSGEFGKDGIPFEKRIEKYNIRDKCSECILYGYDNPILIVNYLIIDKYSKKKENRKKLLNKKYSKVGISLNKHISFGHCCVIVFQE